MHQHRHAPETTARRLRVSQGIRYLDLQFTIQSQTDLQASALCDIFSIIFLIPFVVRLAGVTNTSSPSLMWYHAHLELTIANAFLGLRSVFVYR